MAFQWAGARKHFAGVQRLSKRDMQALRGGACMKVHQAVLPALPADGCRPPVPVVNPSLPSAVNQVVDAP